MNTLRNLLSFHVLPKVLYRSFSKTVNILNSTERRVKALMIKRYFIIEQLNISLIYELIYYDFTLRFRFNFSVNADVRAIFSLFVCFVFLVSINSKLMYNFLYVENFLLNKILN